MVIRGTLIHDLLLYTTFLWGIHETDGKMETDESK